MLGTTLGGRYQIIQPLGGGGFAKTYLAEDRQLPDRHQCVVKQLKPQATDPTTLQIARRLFETEAQVLYRLGHHDQIPQLFAFFEEDQEFYLVQEFIEGHDLSQELTANSAIAPTQPPNTPVTHSSLTQVSPLLQKGRFNEAEVIILLEEILTILDFVHRQNVIHRDISPRNLIRRKKDQQLVLIDFGAVKQITTQMLKTPTVSHYSVGIGTPGYMPSEQARGNPKPSSDVYAVGMIAIQALTGIPPHQLPTDPNTEEILWQNYIIVTPELTEILNKMVRYDFRERYISATEALAAIKTLKKPTLATVPAFQSFLAPLKNYPINSKRYLALTVGLGLMGLGTGTGIYLWQFFKSYNASELYSRGNTLSGLNRYEDALKSYTHATQIMPDYKEAWYKKGQVLYQLERYSDAQQAYDQAIQIAPDYATAWVGRGNVLNQLQRYSEALSAFEQAIKQSPDDAEAWLGKGNALVNLKRYEEAISAYEVVLDQRPTSFDALYRTARTYQYLEEYEDALKAYDQAVEAKVNDPNAWYQRGNVLMQMNRYQEAVKSYEKAIQFNSKFYQAWYSQGIAFVKQGNHQDAVQSFRESTNIKPDYDKAWYSLGWSLHQLRRYEEAISAYDQTLNLQPNDYLAWYNRGNCLYHLERYQDAIVAYNEATNRQPNHAESWYSRGNALANLTQYEDAIASYQQALQYHPDYSAALQAKERIEKRLTEPNYNDPNSQENS